MPHRLLAAVALACTLASPAVVETACPAHYLDGRPPTVDPARDGARELCNHGYALL